MATVIEIIRAHLTSIGAEGLLQPDAECACELCDLAPCCDVISSCQPGWKGSPSSPDHGEWSMYASKEAATASKEQP